jgi:hypothetical protein
VEEYDAFGQRVLGEAGEWCFAWCELNFTGLDSSAAGEHFLPGEYVEMESWNRQLRALNGSFLSRGGAERLARFGIPGKRGWLPLSALERLL